MMALKVLQAERERERETELFWVSKLLWGTTARLAINYSSCLVSLLFFLFFLIFLLVSGIQMLISSIGGS